MLVEKGDDVPLEGVAVGRLDGLSKDHEGPLERTEILAA
jgi:hypothetical protein